MRAIPLQAAGKISGLKPDFYIKHAHLIELLHPRGFASRILVLGSGYSKGQFIDQDSASVRPVDLVMLTPPTLAGETNAGIKNLAGQLVDMLNPDGILYIMADPSVRMKLLASLGRHGLTATLPILHFSNFESSSWLVPLDPLAGSHAIENLIPAKSVWRKLASILLRLPGGKYIIGGLLPSIGYAVKRGDGPPLYHWLTNVFPGANGSFTMRRSWKEQGGAVILYHFPPNESQPFAVAKITSPRANQPAAEGATLSKIQPAANRSGAEIPKPLNSARIGEKQVIFETFIAGRSVRDFLEDHPGQLENVLKRVVSWLGRWNCASRTSSTIDDDRLYQEIFVHADSLSPFLRDGHGYLNRLRAICAKARNLKAPLVATHRDLTMFNLLLDKRGRLGVLDWESAQEQGLPMVDFFYMAADAVMATQKNKNRLLAVRECFDPGGRYYQAIRRLRQELVTNLDIQEEIVGLCFHACWLYHAAKELRDGDAVESKPFLEIVQWLATLQRETSLREACIHHD